MTKLRSIAVLFGVFALLLTTQVYAQEAGDPAEGGAAEEPLPGVPDAPPAPTDESLDPNQAPPEPTAPPSPSDAAAEPVVPAATATDGPKRDERGHWKDIVVLPRKTFLKRRRVELSPIFMTTLNDTLIQHYAVGAEFNYYFTDILSVGVSGMYYFKNVLDQEFYTRYHFRRVPSLNKYIYTATLNFSYVPIYGKFTLFNKWIMHYEAFTQAGIGISGTEIIPRDYAFDSFKNWTQITALFPAVGGRLFINKWLAVHAKFNGYIFIDKFEPTNRGCPPGQDNCNEVEVAKAAADSSFVYNMMFSLGVSFFLPADFKYTTFR